MGADIVAAGRNIICICPSGCNTVVKAIKPINMPEAPRPPRGFRRSTEWICENVADEHAAANEKPRYWFTPRTATIGVANDHSTIVFKPMCTNDWCETEHPTSCTSLPDIGSWQKNRSTKRCTAGAGIFHSSQTAACATVKDTMICCTLLRPRHANLISSTVPWNPARIFPYASCLLACAVDDVAREFIGAVLAFVVRDKRGRKKKMKKKPKKGNQQRGGRRWYIVVLS